MHAEAVYWAVLGEALTAGAGGADGEGGASEDAADPDAGPTLRRLLAGRRFRSLRPLFERAPDDLAALLDCARDDLAPLLALRRALPRMERLLDTLARAGVDLVRRDESRYPAALREALGEAAPDTLWFAGSLELLSGRQIAIAGSRTASPDAAAFARALASGLAARGLVVLGGISRAVERAALEAALESEAGGATAVLGQGMARALPDLQRMHAHLRSGRLLILGTLPPEAVWQPPLEARRAAFVVELAERVVIAQAALEDSSWHLATAALARGRPLLVRTPADEQTASWLERRARPIHWPADPDTLADEALVIPPPEQIALAGLLPRSEPSPAMPRRGARRSTTLRPDGQISPPTAPAGDGVDGVAPSGSSPARRPGSGVADVDPHTPAVPRSRRPRARAAMPALEDGPAPGSGDLAALVLRRLQGRRRATTRGALLQAFPDSESALDAALVRLIAAGQIAQRLQRGVVGYVPLDHSAAQEDRGFQLSLFGQGE